MRSQSFVLVPGWMTRAAGAFIVVLAGTAIASNTGSLAGRVTDRQTGEALAGASVVVENTETGGACDANGRYLVINIPPGRYNIAFSFMGYTDVRVTDVLVVQDQVTNLDMKLGVNVLSTDTTIIVRPPPNMVKPQVVAIERVIDGRDLIRLPVDGMQNLIGMQPGVTQTSGRGWTHLRGGRFNDVAYFVDGVKAQDEIVGTLWSSPRPTTDAIQSVVVITGGFDAEYGEAMSGIIKAVTKEGGRDLSGRLKYLTDEAFPGRTGYNYGYNRLTFSVGGPAPFVDRLRYFLATEYYKTDDDRNARFKLPAPRGEYAAEGKLTLQMPKGFALTRQGLKLTLDGYLSNYQWQPYAHDYKYLTEGIPGRRVRSYKSNLAVNHLLDTATVYEVKLGLFQTGLIIAPRNFAAEQADTTGCWGLLRRLGVWDRMAFRGEDWVFDWPKYRDWEARHPGTDTLASSQDAVLQLYRSYWLYVSPDRQETVPVYEYPAGRNFSSPYLTTDNPYGVGGLFVGEGNERTWHYRATNHVLGKVDLTHTVNKTHELKTGLSLTRYRLSQFTNSLPWDQNPFWDAYTYTPMVVAAYVQDRADYEDLVVRAGLRFDYLDSKARMRAFPESLGSRREIADSLEPVQVKLRLSPRLGLSYPITERLKFRFSYGHFFKNPTFDNLYTYADRTAAELRSRGNVVVGNADMGAEKTIAYELGFDAQLTDIFQFDLTMFYKDVYDLSGVRAVYALPQPYSMYYNVEYARIQGFEATMTRQLAQYWSTRIGYTFQIAKGTASTADAQYQRERPLQLDYYLDQDQRHAAHADFSLSLPGEFSVIPLRGADASVVFSYGSGTPYTPLDQRGNAVGLQNSARMPGGYTLDGRVSRGFALGDLLLRLHCDVTNILNADQVAMVFATTGKPDNDGRVITPYEFSPGVAFGDPYYHPARDYDHDGYLTRTEMYESYLQAYQDRFTPPTFYGAPRKIRLGLDLAF